MIDFLIKSTASLIVLLGIYYLVLEKEKMHQFNRFFLLFSLVFSFVIPLITIEIIKEVANTKVPQNAIKFDNQTTASASAIVEESINYELLIWIFYSFITVLLLIRFIRNSMKLKAKAKSNTAINYKNAKLILLKEKTLPYTFLNHIFINETDYHNRKIEAELFTHELIHVTQKHTLDILLIEILKVFFWFNPIFILYKKAIQLNHEFIADEKVVQSHNNVPFYQNLLLSKANANPTYYLASNLNYSVTKKRLIMMTKTASYKRALVKKAFVLPILSGLVFLLCIKTVAQEKATTIQTKTPKKPATKESTIDSRRDAYYAGVRIIGTNKQNNTTLNKLYEELTPEEKKTYLNYVPEPTTKKQPSAKEYNDFKDSKKYAIWIDDKNVSNQTLENYSLKDFAYFNGSSVLKNARSKKFPQPFQYHLYTLNYFDKNLKNSHLKFSGKSMRIMIGNEKRKSRKH
ncbi:MAG: M56 family metallopeptidase [Flavobacterium sp.]